MKLLGLSDLIQSEVKNKSILFIEPGNNIQGFFFSGLNIINSDTNFIYPNYKKDSITKKNYDYIIIHGFLLNQLHDKYPNIKELNLSCDTLVIDLLGEGGGIVDMVEHFDYQFITYNRIKLLAPIDDYLGLVEKYKFIDFFNYEFAGPRNFCSKYNHMIHHDYFIKKPNYNPFKVLMGLNWSDRPREKLYTCLNNQNREHRSILINELLQSDIIDDGYISNINGRGDVDLDFFEKTYVTKKVNDKKLIIDNDNLLSNRFSVHPWGKTSYIDVVGETSHNLMRFMTEKSVKPFYNLQLPIILGYSGIIQSLRDLGFDLFDDIVDHTYDTVTDDVSIYDDGHKIHLIYNSIAEKKSKLIVDELKRLSKLDFHKIYLDLKERLIHNQNLLYELTIEDNDLVEDYGKWIFGDNITFNKNDYIEKIYI